MNTKTSLTDFASAWACPSARWIVTCIDLAEHGCATHPRLRFVRTSPGEQEEFCIPRQWSYTTVLIPGPATHIGSADDTTACRQDSQRIRATIRQPCILSTSPTSSYGNFLQLALHAAHPVFTHETEDSHDIHRIDFVSGLLRTI